MKKMKAFYLVLVFALYVASVIIFPGIAKAGAVPDGFIGVPWGASRDQIVKTMNERGYQRLTAAPGKLEFKGDFAGTPCQLTFHLLANFFIRGQAGYCEWSDHSIGPQSTYRRIVKELSKKYGPPTDLSTVEVKPNVGAGFPSENALWELVDSRTSDKYRIQVSVDITFLNGAKYAVYIMYSARSLEERLKKKEY